MKDKIEAYKEALQLAKKHSDIFGSDGVPIEVAIIESVIKTLEVCNRFGIEPKYLSFSNYIEVKNS